MNKSRLYMLYNGKKGEITLIAEMLQYAPKNGMPSWETYNFKGSLSLTRSIHYFIRDWKYFRYDYRTFASGINASGEMSDAKYQFLNYR
jgi:hemoglobin/transferrin/lactoferrin receptor protein